MLQGSGAGGLVGWTLCQGLSAAGHQVTPLVRRRPDDDPPVASVWWDPVGGDLDTPGLEGYGAVISEGMRNYCATVGQQAGMDFAEQFRYQRLGMLDIILGQQTTKPDF